MEIVDKRTTILPVQEMTGGDVYECNGNFYLILSQKINGFVYSINLKTGTSSPLSSFNIRRLVKAHLVIED